MSTQFEEIQKQARRLTLQEKAALARTLIQELDNSADPAAARLWIEEAQRRYAAYLRGEIEALPGDEVMQRAREQLR
jgi:putative addiction module component (TIGR02574 family)